LKQEINDMKMLLRLGAAFAILTIFMSAAPVLMAEDGAAGTVPVLIEFSANTKDLYIGGAAGVNMPDVDMAFMLYFSARPIELSVFRETGTDSYAQYNEYRYNFGLLADKRFQLTNSFGLYLNLGVVYSVGDYSGSAETAENEFCPMGGVGYYIGNQYSFRMGYQYMKTPGFPDNRIYIAIMAIF
jgi:hypothetical protein